MYGWLKAAEEINESGKMIFGTGWLVVARVHS